MEETQPERFRRGRRLDDDARRILVNLSQYYPAAILASRSGVSLLTLYRVLDSHRRNGDVHARRLVGPGRRRLLDYEDTRVRDCARSTCSVINSSAKFLVGSLEYRGDAYLDELRDQIRERRGRDVHISTIYRALTRAGFTLKMVICCCLSPLSQEALNSQLSRSQRGQWRGVNC